MTTASKIADTFLNDGQCRDVDDLNIDEHAADLAAEELQHGGATFYIFNDGSVLMTDDDMWDVITTGADAVDVDGVDVATAWLNGCGDAVAVLDVDGDLRTLTGAVYR